MYTHTFNFDSAQFESSGSSLNWDVDLLSSNVDRKKELSEPYYFDCDGNSPRCNSDDIDKYHYALKYHKLDEARTNRLKSAETCQQSDDSSVMSDK